MAKSSTNPRATGEERVFSLVLALVASPQGMSRRDLLSSVYGYAGRLEAGESELALERQFERDKEQVRKLGIPIETIDAPGEPGNNQLARYRIKKDLLQVPSNVRFSAQEIGLLRLASLAWRDGSLGAESRWAGMKLASLGVNLDIRHLGIAPRLELSEPSAPVLQRAIDEGKVVAFDYRMPDRNEAMARKVAPLRLHRAEGRWHLVAYDLERAADRVFLLSRITSQVDVTPDIYDPNLLNRVDATVEAMLNLMQRQRAVVKAREGSIAEARLATRGKEVDGDASRLELGTLDMHALAIEVAGFGDEIVVESPVQLREIVVAALKRVREQHTGGEADG